MTNNSNDPITLSFTKEEAHIDQFYGYGSSITEFDVNVPMDYKHETYINQEGKKVKKLETTYLYNYEINSKNFTKVTTVLVPGKTYHVKIFPILTTVSSEDNLNFLKRQRAILVGGQGLMLAQNQHKDKFPKGKWTISFDKKDALLKDAYGNHWLPYMHAYQDGGFAFDLRFFGLECPRDFYLLCFYNK
jgi:hypothetical protein